MERNQPMDKKPSTRQIIVLAVTICAAYLVYQTYQRYMYSWRLANQTREDAISTVAITHARPGPTRETLKLPGNIEAWYQAPIYAQVYGYVKMWYADYGAKVKKGDVLAEINSPMIDAQFAQAKAALDSQKAKYNLAVVTAQRYLALRRARAVSEQSISVQEANEKSEAAQVQAAEHNVGTRLVQAQPRVREREGIKFDHFPWL